MPRTAIPAADPGLPDDTLPEWSRTVEGRIAQWCAWFDAPPPDPSWRKGDEAAERVLRDWSRGAGASLDWIVCGDPSGMARTWRAAAMKSEPSGPSLAEHLGALQIAARQMQVIFGTIDELLWLDDKGVREVASRLSEIGGTLARKVNVNLDDITLSELGVAT